MDLRDYAKYMMQKQVAPPQAPARPNVSPNMAGQMGHDMGPDLNKLVKAKMMEAMYKNGGPTRPGAPTAVQQAKVDAGVAKGPALRPPMPTKDQSRLAPNQFSDKGAKPTPPPSPWKGFRSQLAEQLLTPGYHDKKRGIWVNSYQASHEARKAKNSIQETAETAKKMLMENGVNGATAEWASKQDPEIQQKIITAQVQKPTKFDQERQKDAAEWAGQRPDVMNDIATLEESLNYLDDQANNPDWLNGDSFLSQAVRTFSGDKILSLTEAGRDLKTNRDLVQGIAAKNLKLILGGQFAQKEGEQLLARAYDKDMTPAENKVRVQRLINSMKWAAAQKDRLYKEVRDPAQREQYMQEIRERVKEMNNYKPATLGDLMKKYGG